MEPFILRNAERAKAAEWDDLPTDIDSLPATVTTSVAGMTRAVRTQMTKVHRETTDDK
jgi:hypothetical protein